MLFNMIQRFTAQGSVAHRRTVVDKRQVVGNVVRQSHRFMPAGRTVESHGHVGVEGQTFAFALAPHMFVDLHYFREDVHWVGSEIYCQTLADGLKSLPNTQQSWLLSVRL